MPWLDERGTEPLAGSSVAGSKLTLLIGRSRDCRKIPIRGRTLAIGAALDNDVVLSDRAVSAYHCELEPTQAAVLVRDRGSRNGTWIDGVRVMDGYAAPPASIRVGRTDLLLITNGSDGASPATGIVAASAGMLRVLAEIDRYAALTWPVVLLGESGVGKEGLAHALHARSPRSASPFVAVNAGSLPKHLVESELFGHERGAFTGAVTAHKGVFEQAHGGTLFLDEIGELPIEMQARLLRVLETSEVRRVGAEGHVRVDVRIVCATHRNLRDMIAEETFRRDLYFRLSRAVVDIPPLRERPEDIAALSKHFLNAIGTEVGPRELTPEAEARLYQQAWHGNARELKNVLSAAAVIASSRWIMLQDLERAIVRVSGPLDYAPSPCALKHVLEQHRGNLSSAARALGMPRSTFRDRLRRT